MATAPITNNELRIVPLREADFAAFEPLFEEQCREWLELFRWDYSGPSRMILQVARDRELEGFVAMRGTQCVGFTYYVIEGGRGSIGDIYVSRDWRGRGIDHQLTAAVLAELARSPLKLRIESQCVGVDNDSASAFFQSRGFERFDRHYMMMRLGSGEDRFPESTLKDPEINIRRWDDNDFNRAAQIIHHSYRGQTDSRINIQYRSEAGCAELLTILTDHVWCGDFLPRVSRVAFQISTGRSVGVLIASNIAPGAGHIGQISVHPAYQGRGLGRRLIGASLAEYERSGFDSVSLAVTSSNTRALHLYEACGFRTIHTFPVFVRDKS